MTPTNGQSSILASVHALEWQSVCESPLCDVEFPQTGLAMEPRRFCSGECRQQASLIRRVAALLERQPDCWVNELDGYVLRRAKAMLEEVGIVKFHEILERLT